MLHAQVDTIQDFLCKFGIKPRMQLQEIVNFSLNHVIIRPTKIIKSTPEKAIYRQHLSTGFTEVLHDIGRSDDDMLQLKNDGIQQLHTWFYAQLEQKILNGIYAQIGPYGTLLTGFTGQHTYKTERILILCVCEDQFCLIGPSSIFVHQALLTQKFGEYLIQAGF